MELLQGLKHNKQNMQMFSLHASDSAKGFISEIITFLVFSMFMKMV